MDWENDLKKHIKGDSTSSSRSEVQAQVRTRFERPESRGYRDIANTHVLAFNLVVAEVDLDLLLWPPQPCRECPCAAVKSRSEMFRNYSWSTTSYAACILNQATANANNPLQSVPVNTYEIPAILTPLQGIFYNASPVHPPQRFHQRSTLLHSPSNPIEDRYFLRGYPSSPRDAGIAPARGREDGCNIVTLCAAETFVGGSLSAAKNSQYPNGTWRYDPCQSNVLLGRTRSPWEPYTPRPGHNHPLNCDIALNETPHVDLRPCSAYCNANHRFLSIQQGMPGRPLALTTKTQSRQLH